MIIITIYLALLLNLLVINPVNASVKAVKFPTGTPVDVCIPNDFGGSCTASGGSGTVTSASVVTANGFSGSVANPTTTPAITLNNINWQVAIPVPTYGINWQSIVNQEMNSTGINWFNVNGVSPINPGGINWFKFPSSGIATWQVAGATPSSITAPSGTVLGTTDTQTLSNKTLANTTIIGSSTGVSVGATTGAISFTGIGNTNNEDFKLDLETTSNQASFSSSTGVSVVSFASMGVRASANGHAFGPSSGISSLTGILYNNTGGNSSSTLNAMSGSYINSSTNAGAGAIGGDFTGTKSGSGTATDLKLIGIRGTATYSAGTGTQGVAYGVYGSVNNSVASGTITDAYSVYGAAPTATGTITNPWAGGFNGTVKMFTSSGVSANGAFWNDSTQNSLATYDSSIKQIIPGIIFTQTADKTVASSTSETSIVGTGVGGLTLPANFFVAGKTIRVTMSGVYSTVAVTGDTVTVKIKYGSTVLASKATTALVTGGTNLAWFSDVLITCRSTGASGSVQVSGGVRYQIASSAIIEDELNNAVATTTLDTTASGLLDVTVTHSGNSASNSVKSLVGSFEVLN